MGRSPKKPPARQRYSNDRLGRIAQNHVGGLAEAANLNQSASNPDLDGWDFHFSVPRNAPLDGSNFFDADPPLAAMFVQVKGTIRSKRRCAIKLSQWRHAATMAMPFFFIVLEFDTPPAPARMFVVHVDKELVESVAKRLRSEGAKARKKPPDLRGMTMELTWDTIDEAPCTPDGLRAALLKHVGDDAGCYAQNKIDWWTSAGKATVRNLITLHLVGSHGGADRRLADWALGLTESLKVDEFRRVEHRWGIARRFEPNRNVTVSFGTPPSIGRTRVVISDRDGVERAEFEADVFCNLSFVPYLPKDTWAIRFQWNFLHLIKRATSDAVGVRLAIPPNQPPVRLLELATAARAIRLLSGPSKMTYTIPKYGDGEYTSEFSCREGAFRAGGDGDIAKTLDAAEAAWWLCSQLGIASDVAITPYELEEQAEEFVMWRLAETSDRVTAQVDTVDPRGLAHGERALFLWFRSVLLETYELVAAFIVDGNVQLVDTRGRILARPRCVRRWIVDRRHRSSWRSRDFPRLSDELQRELESQGKVLVIEETTSPELPANER